MSTPYLGHQSFEDFYTWFCNYLPTATPTPAAGPASISMAGPSVPTPIPDGGFYYWDNVVLACWEMPHDATHP